MNDGRVIERRIRSFVSSVDDSDWDEVVRRAGGSQRTSLTAASGRQGSPPAAATPPTRVARALAGRRDRSASGGVRRRHRQSARIV